MKGARNQIARAARIRAAVTLAASGRGVVSPGARIEEILGEEIVRYPNEIMSLDVLPSIALTFIGYTADFEEIEVQQHADGMNDACAPLVGWKPLRMGALTGRIQPQEEPDATGYKVEPYRGIPFCTGAHGKDRCRDPFCYRAR